jgi:glycosyltransferase involved in cell wall biosynthesis
MSKVTVIIPVYNGEKYIADAIRSIHAQTYRDWELIVVDDGSIDCTRKVVSSFGDCSLLVHPNNRGPSAARNFGLREAVGKYIVFLDADDYFHSTFLATTVGELDRQDDWVVGVFTGWSYADLYGKELLHTRSFRSGLLEFKDFLDINPFPIHAALTRRDALVSSHGFDEQMYAMEDWDMWLRLTSEGKSFFGIPKFLAYYRLHGSSNSSFPERMRNGRLKALEKLYSRSDLPANVLARKSEVFARALLQSSAGFFSVDSLEDGIKNFCEAVIQWSDILLEDETYFATICAKQPKGFKGTSNKIDLIDGEQRIIKALNEAADTSDICAARLAVAYSKAFLTLGRLAYGQRDMKNARRYLNLARGYDISIISHSSFLPLFFKSLLTPGLLKTLKRSNK